MIILSIIFNIEPKDWFLLIAGAIIGTILGWLLTVAFNYFGDKRRKKKFRKALSSYEGFYLGYEKYDSNENIVDCFELKRKNNIFIIKDGITTSGHEDFDAEIIIDENGLRQGYGFYQHQRSPDKVIRFGFWEIQLAGNEILVHVTIHKDGEKNSDAYRWVKQKKESIEELTNWCRNEQIKNKLKKFPQA